MTETSMICPGECDDKLARCLNCTINWHIMFREEIWREHCCFPNQQVICCTCSIFHQHLSIINSLLHHFLKGSCCMPWNPIPCLWGTTVVIIYAESMHTRQNHQHHTGILATSITTTLLSAQVRLCHRNLFEPQSHDGNWQMQIAYYIKSRKSVLYTTR